MIPQKYDSFWTPFSQDDGPCLDETRLSVHLLLGELKGADKEKVEQKINDINNDIYEVDLHRAHNIEE